MDEFIRSKVIRVGDFSAEILVEKDWNTKENFFDIFVRYRSTELSSSALFLKEMKIKEQIDSIKKDFDVPFTEEEKQDYRKLIKIARKEFL